MKKLLTVGVIVLFLGLVIAPSINANVSKDKETKRTQEVSNDMENKQCIVFGRVRGFSCLIPLRVLSFRSYDEIASYIYRNYFFSPIKRIIKIGWGSNFIFGGTMYIYYDPWYNEPVEGNIYTIGSEGFLTWYGKFYGNIRFYKHFSTWNPAGLDPVPKDYYFFNGITGFRGIRIFLFGTCYFFGYAREVKLSYSIPPH
jgi:hypothetical protein